MFKINSEFYKFTTLNILDKAIAYVTPLLILHFFNDIYLYNSIEFVYSMTLIINIVIDFGLRGYMNYSFRFEKKVEDYTSSIIKTFNFLLLIYSILFILIFLISKNYLQIDYTIIYLIFLRGIYLSIINIYRVYFRLNSNPIYIFIISIPIQIFTVILILIIYHFNKQFYLHYFFISILIFLIFYFIKMILKKEIQFNLFENIKFIKQSLKYYWAIIFSSIISIMIGNYAKVYSYLNLSEIETAKISFLLRTLMLIQLMHASFAAFNLKKIFSNSSKVMSKKLFYSYLIILLFSSILVMIFISTYSKYLDLNYTIDLTFIFLYIYVLSWCVGAYFEQYINKFNKNISILYNNLISIASYFMVIYYYRDISIVALSSAMAFSSLIYLILTIIRVIKLNIKIS
jgi:hypothetical protein